jgi:hypothetical protein
MNLKNYEQTFVVEYVLHELMLKLLKMTEMQQLLHAVDLHQKILDVQFLKLLEVVVMQELKLEELM